MIQSLHLRYTSIFQVSDKLDELNEAQPAVIIIDLGPPIVPHHHSEIVIRQRLLLDTQPRVELSCLTS